MQYFANKILAQFNCAGILWNGEVGAYELFDSTGHTTEFVSYDEMQCAISDYEEDELTKDMYEEYILSMYVYEDSIMCEPEWWW